MENSDEPLIQISAKNLGYLALPDFCPRCFYIKLKLKFILPYQIFPGIFSSIDSYSKKITWAYFQKYKRIPPWLTPFGELVEPVKFPHFSKYFIIDENTNIKLTGAPDEIFLCADNSYFILDYKTAKFTKNQDLLLPLYTVQLNSYAYIFEKLNMGDISGIALCYYEPLTNISADNLDSLLISDGFHMAFKAHLLKLELNPGGIVMPLLWRVREIVRKGDIPEGREGCKDCWKLEELVRLVR